VYHNWKADFENKEDKDIPADKKFYLVNGKEPKLY